MTIIAAAMVAANWNARITVCGFALFIAASLAWIADGIIEPKNSLIIQNAVLLLINVLAYGAGYRAPVRSRHISAYGSQPYKGSGLLPV